MTTVIIRIVVGDSRSLTRLNTWLADWCLHNPAYFGPNWKCGQEAAIRVMHLAMAALILDQQSGPSPALLTLIRAHLKRIAPTLQYALAQDNFFDYIAMGLPVLNNYPGWLADMIAEHRCGIAAPPDNPIAFADALEKMADHPA